MNSQALFPRCMMAWWHGVRCGPVRGAGSAVCCGAVPGSICSSCALIHVSRFTRALPKLPI